jgi:hypothetical protein
MERIFVLWSTINDIERSVSMEPTAQQFSAYESRNLSPHTIRTTLYKLVEAINEELEPGEDWMISATLVDLASTGRLRYLGESLH